MGGRGWWLWSGEDADGGLSLSFGSEMLGLEWEGVFNS